MSILMLVSGLVLVLVLGLGLGLGFLEPSETLRGRRLFSFLM